MILPIGKARNLAKNNGFTLIELLLVVVIIVVVAGLNLPIFKKTYNRLKLENHALKFLSISRYARTRAIAESKIYRLNFDIQNKTYWLSQAKDDMSLEFERLGTRFGKKFQIPDDISIEISADFLNIYPNGDMDDVRIAFINSDNLRYELVKRGVFGEFKIKKEKQ